MIRVGIITRTARLAEEVAATLESEEQLDITGLWILSRTASSRTFDCDVLLAVGLPQKEISIEGPPVVALTDSTNRNLPVPPFSHAILPLLARPEEITAALLAAASGLYVLTAEQAAKLMRSPRLPDLDQAPPEKLTARELEVLRMLAEGLANKEIARALRLSDHTVKFHVLTDPRKTTRSRPHRGRHRGDSLGTTGDLSHTSSTRQKELYNAKHRVLYCRYGIGLSCRRPLQAGGT